MLLKIISLDKTKDFIVTYNNVNYYVSGDTTLCALVNKIDKLKKVNEHATY